MLADVTQIPGLIPQKSPMVMVDGLLYSDNEKSISQLQLTDSNLFCTSGYFQEVGLIENMAQTAALRSGFEASLKDTKPRIGFIGAVKKLQIFGLPHDTDVLETTIYILHELMNAMVVKGEIYVDGKLMAKAEMNIFLQDVESIG